MQFQKEKSQYFKMQSSLISLSLKPIQDHNRTQLNPSSSHSTFHPGATSSGSHISAFHDFEINCEAMAFPGTVEPNYTETTNKTKPLRIPRAPPLSSAGCAQSFSRESCSADNSSSNMHTHTNVEETAAKLEKHTSRKSCSARCLQHSS